MQLIENKSLILIEEPSDIHYKDCELIVTIPIFFNPKGVISINDKSNPTRPFSEDSSIYVGGSFIHCQFNMLKIFQYIGLEKKLLKLYRACDIDKNKCSKLIFNQFPFKEFDDVLGVWQLPNVNEQMWDNYKIFFPKQKPLPEQKLLKKASDLLNIKLRELSLNLKTFHESHRKQKSKKMSQDSSKDAVGS